MTGFCFLDISYVVRKKKSLYPFYETLTVIFIPFLIVLFIEFVLRFGMGPFVEKVSFFSAFYASIIAVCSYVWIRKKIIYAFLPVILFSVVIALLFKDETTMVCRFLYFFISLLILSFVSVIGYAIFKVIGKHSISNPLYILKFFVGLFIFVCGTFIIHILSGFFNPHLSVVQTLISGIKEGLLIGSAVTVVTIILSKKTN